MTLSHACLLSAASAISPHSTGKERDAESGNDYFGARYYGSTMGRFLSPDYTGYGLDPAPVPWANYENPQTMNLYGYVLNNPLTRTDPDGNDCISASNASSSSITVSWINTNDPADCPKGFNYVNGAINPDSFTYNSQTGDLGYSFSKYANGSGSSGAGVIGQPASFSDTLAYGLFHSPNAVSTWNNSSGTVNTAGGAVMAATAGAVCVVFCGEAIAAAAAIKETYLYGAAELSAKMLAYLESRGIPATAATLAVRKMLMNGNAVRGINAIRFYAHKLNEFVQQYHQSQAAPQHE